MCSSSCMLRPIKATIENSDKYFNPLLVGKADVSVLLNGVSAWSGGVMKDKYYDPLTGEIFFKQNVTGKLEIQPSI